MPGLADPDVLEDGDRFILSGTGGGTLQLFTSTDLEQFTAIGAYNPTSLDPAHDYCYLWAPDLSRDGGDYVLFFSAHQVAQGAACPPSGQTVTTFYATAPDANLAFGLPRAVAPGNGAPQSRIADGCPAEGCEKVVRIDSTVVSNGATRRLFYVWFQGGNNISSFDLDQPGAVRAHAGPARFPQAVQPDEEIINEAPEVLVRDGRYYLFYSAGFFDSKYAMYYLMSDSLMDLTRARATRRLSSPLVRPDGTMVSNQGHNSIVRRGEEYWNFFHVGSFDAAGRLTSRATVRQRLVFAPDGTLVNANAVTLRWPKIPGERYSLDVQKRDGTWIGPCVNAGILGDRGETTFNGLCPSAGGAWIHKADVTAFRLYHSGDGSWTQFVEQPYDGVADDVTIDLGGGVPTAIALGWNELATGTEYSLDVQRADGSWIAPCVGAGVLGQRISTVFTGACSTAGTTVPPASVRSLRVCSASNGDWANARCGAVAYDGRALRLDIAIP
ncbi:MAG: family 43 glycosylhydrolase [Deltaproteobacteria bacterium]|nr:family 43 glycosylhydrolase [Deltaproteobacteria bacterium]